MVEESRAKQAGEGIRECALVVSFAARLPPSAVEKPVRALPFSPKYHSETLFGGNTITPRAQRRI